VSLAHIFITFIVLKQQHVKMNNRKIALGLVFTLLAAFGFAQKPISDITLSYDITVETNNEKPSMANMFNGATTTVYIKGNSHRTEAVNSLGTSTTIYDGKGKNAVILKEYGAQKLLVRLTPQNWLASNKNNDAIKFVKGTEIKTIAGYNCTKSVAKLDDGSEIIAYSTKDIIIENKDYNAQFKSIDGLVLEYEFTVKTMKIINTVSKVTIATVNPAKFEIPKTGYREMTYEESIKK
jgi:GLPGLI family protein